MRLLDLILLVGVGVSGKGTYAANVVTMHLASTAIHNNSTTS